MDRYELESTCEQLENTQQQIEQQELALKEAQQRENLLDCAVKRIAEDAEIISGLEEKLGEAKAETTEMEQQLEETRNEISGIESQLHEAAEQLNDEYAVLAELSELGEDISESLAILEERRSLIQACQDRLQILADKLGITIDELFPEIMSDVGNVKRTATESIVEKKQYPEGTNRSVVTGSDDVLGEDIIPLVGITPDMKNFAGQPICKGSGSYWYPSGGPGFEKFLEYEGADWSDYTVDRSEYGNGVVRMINSRCIEGVSLFSGDVESPERFWSQHDSNGTKESFVEIASFIPDVKAKLNAGATIDELMMDDKLSACVGIYFRPDSGSSPTVLELDDGVYVFQSNGRHRILAARELGYSFPVKVIGKIVRKQ